MLTTVLGIDEAGRGPIIGPMVICGVLCRTETLGRLKEIGVKDSKVLTPARREELATHIQNLSDNTWLVKIPPQKLDRENLNEIEFKVMADIIRKSHASKVIIDAPTPARGIPKYCSRMKNLIGNLEIQIIAENHADAIYPIVSAASILAKVCRDKEIKKLHKKYGDFGSGYTSDPKTKEFIKHWYKYPEIVRAKWETIENLLVAPGKIMVIGAPDTGKTEFCKRLVNLGLQKGYQVGFLDLDIGQSHIGPPGSLGFGIAKKRIRNLSKIKPTMIQPVGTLSPAESIDRIIDGIKVMLPKISNTVNFLVIDTTGYVKGTGAVKLKAQKIELIEPDRIIFIEQSSELEPLAKALQPREVYRLPVSSRVKKKSSSQRRHFREQSSKLH